MGLEQHNGPANLMAIVADEEMLKNGNYNEKSQVIEHPKHWKPSGDSWRNVGEDLLRNKNYMGNCVPPGHRHSGFFLFRIPVAGSLIPICSIDPLFDSDFD